MIHATPDKSRYHTGSEDPAHPPVILDWLTEHTGKNTLRAYRADIRLWETWCAREGVHPTGATRADCNRFKTWLASTPSDTTGAVRKPRTQARIIACLASLYNYMESEELITRSPLAHVKRPTASAADGATKALTEDQAERLLDVARDYGTREYVAISTMLDTAVRASGLLGIHIEHLHVDDGRLVARVVLKGGDVAEVPFSAAGADAVDRLRGERTDGPLFLGRHGAWSYDALHAACLAVGVRADAPFPVTPHVLRATWATIALSNSVSPEYVRSVMGHKKIETTLGYDRRREDMARKVQAVDVVSRAIRKRAAA